MRNSRSVIWLRMLEELGMQCSVDTSRDAVTVARRVADEGEPFFTDTLPRFGKDFERSLALRSIPSDLFEGWARRPVVVSYYESMTDPWPRVGPYTLKKVGVPRFLGGFLDHLFDSVLREPVMNAFTPEQSVPVLRTFGSSDDYRHAADVVAAVRQLTLAFGKEEARCAKTYVDAAVEEFVQTDRELDAPLG